MLALLTCQFAIQTEIPRLLQAGTLSPHARASACFSQNSPDVQTHGNLLDKRAVTLVIVLLSQKHCPCIAVEFSNSLGRTS